MPSYTFTLNVETEVAEARLRAFRATAEKELSSIQQATANASVGRGASGGGSSGRAGGSLLTIDKTIERQRTAIAKAETDQRNQIAKSSVGQTALTQQQILGIEREKSRQSILQARLEVDEKQRLALQEVHNRINAANTIIATTKNQAAQEIAAVQRTFGERARALREDTAAQMETLRSEMSDALDAKPRSQEQINSIDLAMTEAKENERRLTAVAQSEAKERIAAITNEANARINQSERSKQAAIADEKVLTATRTSTSKWGNLDHVLKTGFLAYGTYLAASQAIAGIYDFGKVGAQQERTAQTFEQLAKRIDVSADGMREAVQRASRGTIDEMTGMGLSAQVLAQNFAGSLEDIEGDTEILIRAARRFSQVYTDENGQNLSTQAIYARLIKFSREGNKELVDQFGLSNELIANLLNIPNEGLRGAEGAANRWKGMIMALELELKKLGEATETPADKIEAAEARWTTAVNKIRESTIGISTAMAEAGAGVTEYFSRVPSDYKIITSTRPEMERIQKLGADGTNNPAVNNAVRHFLEIDAAWVQGKISQDEYWEAVNDSIQQFHRLNEVLESFRPNLDTAIVALPQGAALTREDFPGTSGGASAVLRQQAQARQRGLDVVAGRIAPADLTEAERDYRMAVGNSAERLAILQAAVDSAEKYTTEYWKAMAELNGATLSLAGEMDAIRGEIRGKVGDIKQWQLDMRLVGATPASKLAIMQQYGGEGIKPGSPEERAYQLEIANLQQSVIEENKRLGEEAQREWKQTAKDVEQMFESAADKLMGIPGVTSITPVTGQEVLDTRYGMYQDQPDEWRRRVHGELEDFTRDTRTDENGVTTETIRPRATTDYSDVSREQVEKLTGMAAGTPWDVMLPRLDRKWENSSLFADKANLGLMNMDAIRGQYEEMKAGATGRANLREHIMGQLGISQADAALITGTQAPIVQMMTGGQSEEEITAQLGPVANTLRTAAMASLTSGSGFINDVASGWKKDIDENIAKLDPLGDMIGKRLRDRINTTIGGLGLIDGIVARVVAELAEGV